MTDANYTALTTLVGLCLLYKIFFLNCFVSLLHKKLFSPKLVYN